jgi:acyl-CoA thioesterase-1
MRQLATTAWPLRRPTRALARAALAAAVVLGASLAEAAAQTVVAFGGSNTRGKGVSSSDAYPARLEALLRARGVNATVINAGVDGDTSRGMLARMDSDVPSGTRVVILHASGRNDQRRGVAERSANIAEMKRRFAARNIRVVVLEPSLLQSARSRHPQSDGVHITPPGHAMIAAALLPRVMAALRR